MNKHEIMRRIAEVGVLPVVRASSSEEAFSLIEAIGAGGIGVFEITMTVPGALGVIGELAKRLGDKALVGAGTVLDAETARACILAGAQFIVSPALDLGTVELCRRYAVPVMPGALTPTEVVTAWQAGADAVKVFPCSAVGGANYLKALKAPLPQIDLIPTGGVSLSSVRDFIAAGAWSLGAGSDLADTKAIRAGDARKVTETARAYVSAVHEARASLTA